jgi:hypothetical protein
MVPIPLAVTPRWRQAGPFYLPVPGYGWVQRSGNKIVVYSSRAANWLRSHGYCRSI